MTLEDRVHALRLRLFRRAEDLGNVSTACLEAGVSRSAYYQLRQRFLRYGADGLHPKHRKGRPGRPPELEAVVERRILAEALAQPAWGPQRISDQLGVHGIQVAPSTVYRALRRHGLGTRPQRFGLLERHSASRAGLLTERTRRALQKARPTPSRRHVEAKEPGELVCFDCFFIGRLKGVGKVWQITACDAACSYAAARIIPANTAEHAVRFLLEVLLPLYEAAGWPLQRILTDRGSEFRGDFDVACDSLEIRHTRTKPRHGLFPEWCSHRRARARLYGAFMGGTESDAALSYADEVGPESAEIDLSPFTSGTLRPLRLGQSSSSLSLSLSLSSSLSSSPSSSSSLLTVIRAIM